MESLILLNGVSQAICVQLAKYQEAHTHTHHYPALPNPTKIQALLKKQDK